MSHICHENIKIIRRRQLKTIQEKTLSKYGRKGGRFYEDCSVAEGEDNDDDSNRQSESCKK
jgi:hypothetical protein